MGGTRWLAGGQNQLDVLGLHERLAQADGGVLDALDQARRRAGSLGRLTHDTRSLHRALDGARVRGQHQRVARLQRDQRLEYGLYGERGAQGVKAGWDGSEGHEAHEAPAWTRLVGWTCVSGGERGAERQQE